MFSGMVEHQGKVRSMRGGVLVVETKTKDLALGESLSVNGCCLTVAERNGTQAQFYVSTETLEKTQLGELRPGDQVNLERTVTPATRLSGHWVQGHVDGVGTLADRALHGDGTLDLTFRSPTRYCVPKGSITINGVSLTINTLTDSELKVRIVPHTLKSTNLSALKLGQKVNVEFDILAKYVEKLCRN